MARMIVNDDSEDSAAANTAYATSLYQPSVAKPTAAEIMKMVTGLLPNPNNLQMSDALAALKTEAAVKPTGLLASTTPAATTSLTCQKWTR